MRSLLVSAFCMPNTSDDRRTALAIRGTSDAFEIYRGTGKTEYRS